jgi:glycosyltransferase 2 family protein
MPTGPRKSFFGSEMMAHPKKRLFLTAVKCVVSGSLICWIIQDVNLGEILMAVHSANNALLVLAFSLTFVGLYVSVDRWRVLLEAQGVNVSFSFLFRSYLVGIFFNNILPSTIGGDTVRGYDSWRVAKNKRGALAVIFVDRFLGTLALMLFAFGAQLVSRQLTATLPFLALGTLLGTVGMVLFVWIIFIPSRQMSAFICRTRLPFSRKLQSILDRIIDAFLGFQGRKDVLARALGLSLILQANVVMHYYLFAKALDFPVPLYNFFLIIPLTLFIMMVPVSINAIGIRESALVFFFAPFGVPKSAAIALAWLTYGVVIFQGLLGAIVYAFRK